MQVHGDDVRVGLHSGQQYASFTEYRDVWQRAEALGFDWMSAFDHFRPPLGGPDGPCFEGTTVLAAVAAATTRIRCGLLVAAVTWRHPAVLAAAAATIDHVSGGRLELGIGAAGPDLGYAQYRMPFPSAHQRLDMLDEACRVIRTLWTEPGASFDGTYYGLDTAYLAPRPLQDRVPLLIGGEGERRMLRIVADHADIWNALARTPETYRRKCAALERHCAEAGRDAGSIRRSVTFRAVLDVTEEAAQARAAELFARLPADSPDRAEYLVVGTPERCADVLREYHAMGVRDFLLGARPPVDWRTVELMAERVAPLLRSWS